MSDRFKNVFLLCGSLLVGTLAAEWSVRFLAPQTVNRFPQGLFVNDRLVQYRLAANFSNVISTAEYRTLITTNGQGLREAIDYGPKPANTERILALGDSFTMGVGVESGETFSKVLERDLRSRELWGSVQVINAGVAGYNTRQELTYLETDGLSLEPDIVLLNFYVGNDIHDNFTDRLPKVVNGFLHDADDKGGILPSEFRKALSRSHLYHLLWPLQRRLFHADFAEQERRVRLSHLAVYAREPSAETEAMWTATWQELERAERLSRERGFKLVVVVIPELEQTDPNAWHDVVQSYGSTYERDVPNRRITAYCAGAGIPVIDLLPTFDADRKPRQNYFRVDGHWTVRGNRLAGTVLGDFLDEHGLLAARRSLESWVAASGGARPDLARGPVGKPAGPRMINPEQ